MLLWFPFDRAAARKILQHPAKADSPPCRYSKYAVIFFGFTSGHWIRDPVLFRSVCPGCSIGCCNSHRLRLHLLQVATTPSLRRRFLMLKAMLKLSYRHKLCGMLTVRLTLMMFSCFAVVLNSSFLLQFLLLVLLCLLPCHCRPGRALVVDHRR